TAFMPAALGMFSMTIVGLPAIIFFQEGDERPRLHISRSAGLAATKNRDGLALIVGYLRKRHFRDQRASESQHRYYNHFHSVQHQLPPTKFKSHRSLRLCRSSLALP